MIGGFFVGWVVGISGALIGMSTHLLIIGAVPFTYIQTQCETVGYIQHKDVKINCHVEKKQ